MGGGGGYGASFTSGGVVGGSGQGGYYSDKRGPFHACTSVIPVVYFPVKVISAAKYSRDQSISLTTVPREARGPRGCERREEGMVVAGCGGLVASELQTKEKIRGGL